MVNARHTWILLGFTLVGVLRLPVMYAQEPERLLTLREAVAEALIRNDRVVNQHDTSERAILAVRGARNAFEPKIVPNVHGSFGQIDVNGQEYRLDFSQRFVNGTELRAGIGASTAQIPSTVGGRDIRFYNTDTTVLLSQPLLKGFGTAFSRRTLTKAEMQQTEAARQRAILEQQVTIDVAAAYYRVVAQKALVKVARQSFDRARQLREASEAKLDAGLVSQLDVLRAQQLVFQAELQLFDAQGAADDARDQLSFLTGREPDEPFDVVGEIPSMVEAITPADAIAAAMTNRLDLQSAMAEAADAERAISFARNQLRPQVDLNLAFTRRQTAETFSHSFGLNGFQFATFLNVLMPIDRTPQEIEYQSALLDRDRLRRGVDNVRRRIRDDVARQMRDRDRALRNLTGAERNVQIAQREVEVARLRYERGLSNNLDVITAETNLLSAESRRILTLGELAVMRLSLRATMGVLNPTRDTDVP